MWHDAASREEQASLSLRCGQSLPIKVNPHSEFDIDTDALSLGSFSRVHRAKSQSSDRSDVVFKIFTARQSPTDDSTAFSKEAAALKAVGEHPNIAPFIGVFIMPVDKADDTSSCEDMTSLRFALCFEYCVGGDLLAAVKKKTFSEDTSRGVMECVLRALSHVHAHGYVHRDVVPENVLLFDDGRACLTDFGNSTLSSDSMSMETLQNPGYAAPEVWMGTTSGREADIFSSGVMHYFVISGRELFSPTGVSSVCRLLRATHRSRLSLDASSFPPCISATCKSFIGKLLEKLPEDRPTAAQALCHSWFSTSIDTDQETVAPKTPTCKSLNIDDRRPSKNNNAEISKNLSALFMHPLIDQPLASSQSSCVTVPAAPSEGNSLAPTGPTRSASKKPFFVRRRLLQLSQLRQRHATN